MGKLFLKKREKQKRDSAGHIGLGQLRASFQKKAVVAAPEYPPKSQVLNPDSIHRKPVPEHSPRGNEVKKNEKNEEAPKISPLRLPIDSRSVADPFSETVLTLLPDDQKHCSACHDKMALLFGMNGPYLKCSKCHEEGQIPFQTLFETLSKLRPPCNKCGRPMLRVLPNRVFAGCSRCAHTEAWKVLAIRLKQRAETKG